MGASVVTHAYYFPFDSEAIPATYHTLNSAISGIFIISFRHSFRWVDQSVFSYRAICLYSSGLPRSHQSIFALHSDQYAAMTRITSRLLMSRPHSAHLSPLLLSI